MLRAFRSNSTHCTVIGLGLMMGSLLLQGLSTLIWAEPARTRSLLEFLYGARGALLQALNVMAVALVTAGLTRARLSGGAVICAAWALTGCLIEAAQHPAIVNLLLEWTDGDAPPPRPLDTTLGLLWNARFSWSEIAASLVGGGIAFEILRKLVQR